jgi:predicted RNA-binding protein with PIN domain
MPYLVDGHNLIPKLPGLSLSAIDDELDLIERLRTFCQQKRKDVEVFFDQAPPGAAALRRYGRVKAHFVRQGSTADAAIMSRLQQLRGSAFNYTVVSSDHQVQAAARAARAKVITSEAFASQLMALPQGRSTSLPGESILSAEEIEYWEIQFKRRSGGKSLTKS